MPPKGILLTLVQPSRLASSFLPRPIECCEGVLPTAIELVTLETTLVQRSGMGLRLRFPPGRDAKSVVGCITALDYDMSEFVVERFCSRPQCTR